MILSVTALSGAAVPGEAAAPATTRGGRMADQVTAEEADLVELNLARREHWVAQLERHAAGRPDQPAIRFLGETTTWRQFADRVGRLAGAFARRGVGPGDRVAVMTGNRPEFV